MISTGRLLVGAVLCLVFVVVGITASDRRDRPGTRSFAFLCSLLGLFALLSAGPYGLGGLTAVRAAVYEGITVAWLLFASAYTGRGPVISRSLLAGLAGFVLLILLGITIGPAVPSELEPLLFAMNFVIQSLSNALGVYGMLVAGRSVLVYDDLPVGGTVVVSTVAFGFVCLSVLLVGGSVLPQRTTLNAYLVVLSLIALVLFVTTRRLRVFAGSPSAGHLAREQILDEMDAAVVIVDRTGRVLDCNDAFESMFGVDRRPTIGDQLDDIVGSLSAGEQVLLTTADGKRECAIERTVLTATGGAPIGEAYRIRDVTVRRTREQRLDVLNRVLRHNLRNDLDAIHAFAETLEAEPDSVDAQEMGSRIEGTASELSDIGATVGRGERLLGREQLTQRSVDVGSLARDVRDQFAEQYPGTVAVRAADAPTIRTDPGLVETLLSEVVENGLEHGPGADASVVIDVSASSEGVEIAVEDNGPGIPDRERAVLLDGEESPLRHGSGIGLWLVNWGLSRLGGDLAFREGDRAGSVVTLTVPDNSTGE